MPLSAQTKRSFNGWRLALDPSLTAFGLVHPGCARSGDLAPIRRSTSFAPWAHPREGFDRPKGDPKDLVARNSERPRAGNSRGRIAAALLLPEWCLPYGEMFIEDELLCEEELTAEAD